MTEQNEVERFQVSRGLVEMFIEPAIERLKQDIREKVVGFFYTFAQRRMYTRRSGEYVFCWENGGIHGDFGTFMLEEFYPAFGIDPGEHVVDEMDTLQQMLIDELRKYYATHTDTLGEYGMVFLEDGRLIISVADYPDDDVTPTEDPLVS
jgi:hypothetical protein